MSQTENLLEKIANWCMDIGSTQSSSGNYYIETDDILEMFDVTQEWLNENANEIAAYISAHEDSLGVTDVELDKKGNLEGFDLWIAGEALCKKCGNQSSEHCMYCDVAHPEEWDNEPEEEEEEKLTLENVNLTKELKKAIKNYNLKNIHVGSLLYVPNDRYIRKNEKLCFNINELGHDLSEKNFVIVFNHFERLHRFWTVWETPYMDYESIKEIVKNEFKRRLWGSRQLYYDNGTDLIRLCI